MSDDSSSPKLASLLLVDDEVKVVTTLTDILTKQGYETVGVTSAASALHLLRRQNFDVLITDLQMSQMDGMALLRQSQAIDPHLVTIMMTGHGTIDNAVKAMKLGAFDFVQKPINLESFLPLLTRALEMRRLRQENLQMRETLGIYELSVAIGFTLVTETIVNKVLDAAIQQCEGDEASILLTTADGQGLYVAAARGPRRDEIVNQRLSMAEGIAGWVARNRQPLILNGSIEDPRFAPVYPRPDIQAAVSMPMMVGGNCVGVLNVNAIRPRRPFTLGQIKALTILTGTAAPALKAASLHAQSLADKEEWEQSFNALSDYVCVVNRAGMILRANRAMRTRFEPILGNLIGMDAREAYFGERANDPHDDCFSLLTTSDLAIGECFLPALEGWYSVSCNPLFNSVGEHWGAVFVTRDITRRKHDEEATREARARFSGILDIAEDAIISVREDHRIEVFNQGAENIFGYSAAEVVGQPLDCLLPQESIAIHDDYLRQFSAGPSMSRRMGDRGQVLGRRKDGTVFPAEASISKLVLGGRTTLTTILRDITERKRAEETLRKSELQFRQVWDTSVDGMRLSDAQGVVHMVNSAFCRIAGKPREALVGQPITFIYAESSVSTMLSTYQEQFATRSVPPFFSHDATLWNGKKIYFEYSNSFIDLPGQPPTLLSIVRDVTNHKALEAQLRQSQKMEAFGQLAGGVAHDFNNLLTIISGYSEMILEGHIPAERQRDSIREIRKAGERAGSLTRQLLAFSRKQMLQPVEMVLNILVRETEKMLRRLIGEDIDLATSLEPTLGNVMADAGQIEQVIINLVVNARDAMPTGGLLTIETKNVEFDDDYARSHPEIVAGRYVMLAVTDSGSGMTEEVRARIFEPFYTTKEVGRGTGLGLATVHGIIKQSNGNIEVYSEVGRGTTFKIYLPRVDQVDAAGLAQTHVVSLLPKGTETILLAEDEDALRSMLRIALTSRGYTVLEASDGDNAIRVCKEYRGRIDLLLTDIVMPKLSGRLLADQIVVLRPGIKILYLSGYSDDTVVRHGILVAGMPFLQKPFTSFVLLRKVREVLDTGTPTGQKAESGGK